MKLDITPEVFATVMDTIDSRERQLRSRLDEWPRRRGLHLHTRDALIAADVAELDQLKTATESLRAAMTEAVKTAP